MSVENLVWSQHNFFPWNGICLCHVQLTSFSARSVSLTCFTVILESQITLVYFGGAWEACSLHSSQSHKTYRSFPSSCKQDRKESEMLRSSYNLYHEALLSCAYNLARLNHCEFLCWESSSDWITWVNFSWNTSAQGALPLASPRCQQSSGADKMVDGKSTSRLHLQLFLLASSSVEEDSRCCRVEVWAWCSDRGTRACDGIAEEAGEPDFENKKGFTTQLKYACKGELN